MLVSHLTPREAENMLGTLGYKSPKNRGLDQLPKATSALSEGQHVALESTVRKTRPPVADRLNWLITPRTTHAGIT